MITRCNLPDSITLPCGAILKPVIGGHLEQKPFLTSPDVTKNGWADDFHEISINRMIIIKAKELHLKYRRVSVLARNLRGKLDLYHKPYNGTKWVFVQTNGGKE